MKKVIISHLLLLKKEKGKKYLGDKSTRKSKFPIYTLI